MGYFDLPRGNFELLLKKKGRGNRKAEWQSVMMTDHLYPGDVEECFERWGINYKVLGARYNGKEVKPLTRYHWEHYIKVRGARGGYKEKVLGKYSVRADAVLAVDKRKSMNWGLPKEKRVLAGNIRFVQD